MFRPSDFLLFVKNGFVVGARTLNVTAGHCKNAVGSYEYPHCASVTRRLALDNRTYPAQLGNTKGVVYSQNVKGGSIFTNQPFTNRPLPLRLWYYKWQIVNMYKVLTLYCNASECIVWQIQIVNMYKVLTLYCNASECIVWQMDNMSLCDGTYDWVHMAWTRCITGNPSEAG